MDDAWVLDEVPDGWDPMKAPFYVERNAPIMFLD
jgi:hypothetical protein